jgi:predicted RNA methylase
MTVGRIFERLFAIVEDKGVYGALGHTKIMIRNALRPKARDSFDAELKVDTAREVPLWRLKIPSKNANRGFRYQTVAPSVFFDALAMVPADLRDFTFVDLGCGKGRTLILAGMRGLTKVVGVEFSPDLAAIARRNISRVGVSAEIIEMDASDYNPPNGYLLIYMYNPFGTPILRAVAQNLLEWRRRNATSVGFVVYVNPLCEEVFESFPEFELIGRRDRIRVWKLR